MTAILQILAPNEARLLEYEVADWKRTEDGGLAGRFADGSQFAVSAGAQWLLIDAAESVDRQQAAEEDLPNAG